MSSSLLTATISFLTITIAANCYPVGNERWKSPCGSRVTDFPPLPTQREIIKDMIIRINEGIGLVNNLRKLIAKERVQNENLTGILDSIHLDGFPVEKVSEEVISSAVGNITESHLKTYTQLSTAAIFLEQVRIDEEIYENNAFSSDIITSENKLYDVLCHLQMAIYQLEASVDNYQSRDIMSTELRTISERSERYFRDYIIVKDTRKTFKSLLVIQEAILNSLS